MEIQKILEKFVVEAETFKVGRKFQPLKDYCIGAIADAAQIAGVLQSVMDGSRTELEASTFFNEFYTQKLIEIAEESVKHN